jgi:hypothetical protein
MNTLILQLETNMEFYHFLEVKLKFIKLEDQTKNVINS